MLTSRLPQRVQRELAKPGNPHGVGIVRQAQHVPFHDGVMEASPWPVAPDPETGDALFACIGDGAALWLHAYFSTNDLQIIVYQA